MESIGFSTKMIVHEVNLIIKIIKRVITQLNDSQFRSATINHHFDLYLKSFQALSDRT